MVFGHETPKTHVKIDGFGKIDVLLSMCLTGPLYFCFVFQHLNTNTERKQIHINVAYNPDTVSESDTIRKTPYSASDTGDTASNTNTDTKETIDLASTSDSGYSSYPNTYSTNTYSTDQNLPEKY